MEIINESSKVPETDFGGWVNESVAPIVRKHLKAINFKQEKLTIEIKVNGDREGIFSVVIDKENEDKAENVKVYPNGTEDWDVCIEGDQSEIIKLLKAKRFLDKERKKGNLIVTTKKENDELIKQISDSIDKGSTAYVFSKNVGIFLMVLGTILVIASIIFACWHESSEYAIAKLSDNEPKEIVGYFQEGGNVDKTSIDSISVDDIKERFKIIGVYDNKDNDSVLAVYNTKTQLSKEIALVILFLGYVFSVLGLGLFSDGGISFHFNKISMQSFLTFVLIAPLGIMSIGAIADLLFDLFYDISISKWVLIIYGIAQCACLGLWFAYHLELKDRKEISQKQYSLLELYSIIAVAILTFVWVIYDISEIKLFFGIILVEFMLVQIRIKSMEISDN